MSPDPIPLPIPLPTPTVLDKKPWQTTEFWVGVAASIASLLIASGIIPTTGVWVQIVEIVGLIFGAFGYHVLRADVKTAAAKIASGTMILLFGFILPESGCATGGIPPGCLDAATAAILADSHAVAACGLLESPIPPPTVECIDDSAAAIASDAQAILACVPKQPGAKAYHDATMASHLPLSTVEAAVANAAKHAPKALPHNRGAMK